MQHAKFILSFLTVWFLALAGASSYAQTRGAKNTITVSSVRATPALSAKVAAEGSGRTLERVMQSMDKRMASAIQATRKFEIVANNADLNAVLGEQNFTVQSGNVDSLALGAAQMGKIKSSKYVLTLFVDDFQETAESASIPSLERKALRRSVRVRAVADIYNTTSATLLESAGVEVEKSLFEELPDGIARTGALADGIVAEVAQSLAEKIALRVADTVFPIRVIAKTGNILTLNRAAGAGVTVGARYDVYALGGSLTDPDTGEELGREEVKVGEAEITAVFPKFSKAQTLSDNGIGNGCILRARADVKTKPANAAE